MLRADVGDDSFPVSLFSSSSNSLFPALKILDLEETQVSRPVLEAIFTPNAVKQRVEFDVTSQEPPDGVLRIVVGKRVVKEAWEIEAERRSKQRRQVAFPESSSQASGSKTTDVAKEAWEVEADQGLLTEGAKRRARAMAAVQSSTASASTTSTPARPPATPAKKVLEREQWEIDAEQGLLSAGARRRARAAAAAAAAATSLGTPGPSATAAGVSPTPSRTPSPTKSPSPSNTPATVGAALANPQYYDAASRTLTLPTSAPPPKVSHARSFSLAMPARSQAAPAAAVSELALAIPAPTLPLAAIASQPLAHNLKALILTGRRADPAFTLPAALEDAAPALPYLEELSLENCNLGDSVAVEVVEAAGHRASEPLLPLLARLFPSVRTLDLSYNALSSAALSHDALAGLIFASAPGPADDVRARKGLRQLRLRGNRVDGLEGFQALAERFRGNRDVPEWHLEELDLRDNEIGKMPAELGLLPLDVFLVDGNTCVVDSFCPHAVSADAFGQIPGATQAGGGEGGYERVVELVEGAHRVKG